MWKTAFVEALKKDFEVLREKNPRYSLRAYARKLKISISSLSELMRFKLQVTSERAEQILEFTNLSPREKNRLRVLMGRESSIPLKEISTRACDYLVNWKHRSVLFCFDLESTLQTNEEIASRLGLKQSEVEEIIENLLRLELLARDEQGHIYRDKDFWKSSDGQTNESVHRTHLSNLELGRKALTEIPMNERDFTSMIFTGNREKLPEIRREIRKFYERLAILVDDTQQNEIYQISINLYPIRFPPSEAP